MRKFFLPVMLASVILTAHLEGARAPDAILLTIFLKHDQSLNLAAIQKLQEEQGFWKAFPPVSSVWCHVWTAYLL